MNAKKLKRLATVAAGMLIVLVVAACAIRLRDDEGQTLSAASADHASDALTAKLAECRSVTYEQKDALSECRKAWAEKRRQFLGQKASPASSGNRTSQEGPSLFVPPKDESRLSPAYPPIQQSGKE
jgi:conjugative transfer region protein TrbK